jgi:hypothetical protein
VGIFIPPVAKSPVALPGFMKARLTAAIQNEFPIDLEKYFEGQARVDFEETKTSLFASRGDANAEFKFLMADLPKIERLNVHSNLGVKIPDFQRVVRYFSKTPYAVPAPLNVLRGNIELSVENASLSREISRIPFKVITRLASQVQKLDSESSGELAIEMKGKKIVPQLFADVKFQNVRMVLPRMDLKAPPQLLPDRRIKRKWTPKSAAVASKKPSFEYRVTIRTEGPVDLISNLAQKPIPLSFDFSLSSEESPKGEIRVAQFPVELFRRQAQLDYFKLKLAPKDNSIDGKFTVKYTDYTIYVGLQGPMEAPEVSFWSVPPLEQDQVVAVLLFGRTTDDLDTDSKGSVGSVRGAVADRALNLASLYYLASTPVESIGYDPTTGGISAKVRIQEGTSLNVGLGKNEVHDIGIRRKLGGNWFLNTRVEDPMESGVRTVSTFLEWIFRY